MWAGCTLSHKANQANFFEIEEFLLKFGKVFSVPAYCVVIGADDIGLWVWPYIRWLCGLKKESVA